MLLLMLLEFIFLAIICIINQIIIIIIIIILLLFLMSFETIYFTLLNSRTSANCHPSKNTYAKLEFILLLLFILFCTYLFWITGHAIYDYIQIASNLLGPLMAQPYALTGTLMAATAQLSNVLQYPKINFIYLLTYLLLLLYFITYL